MFFDSHAHINNADYTEQDRIELIEAIERSSLDYVMDIGFDVPSSIMAAKHAAENDFCYAAVGCHPHDTKHMDEEGINTIRQLTKQPKVMAIGEIGLDFHYDLSDRDIQREWFRRQIRLANELKMPIAVHSREADKETMDILIEEGAFSDERKSWFPARTIEGQQVPDARVLIHCFSGSAETAKEYMKLGATISVCGPVTYKNNKKTVAVVEAVPLDYILVETDSPYLAPVPMRGRPNVPMNVEYTAAKIAEIKGLTLEEVAERTKHNAMVFYGIE